MTTTISSDQIRKAVSYLEQEILAAIEKEFAPKLGEVTIRIEPADDKDSWTNLLWFQQSFEPADFGCVSFGLQQSHATALGQQLLLANSVKETNEESAVNAVRELMGQLGCSLASNFSIRAKRAVAAKALTSQPVLHSPDRSFTARLTIGGERFDVVSCASWELLEALLSSETDTRDCTSIAVPAAATSTRNLDVLLEVEMPVSISFGKTQLPLRDVFKLTIGSVVELNRVISEPVDIVVNNSVIARGEVVVVEGNFGVRITQVISKQDRLKSLT